MSEQLTLTRRLDRPQIPVGLRPGYHIRPMRTDDAGVLGDLYFGAYPAGVAGDTAVEARQDLQAGFDGEYGEFASHLSFVVVVPAGPVGAIMTVVRAPWPDVPDGPFVIDLFIGRDHRRLGLGASLLDRTLVEAGRTGADTVSLRVNADNEPALALYRSFGFQSV